MSNTQNIKIYYSNSILVLCLTFNQYNSLNNTRCMSVPQYASKFICLYNGYTESSIELPQNLLELMSNIAEYKISTHKINCISTSLQ